ncbi:hypothetical protein FLAVO9R_40203 [Flavobacterium sp. 9R]|nr:hypothetical protein FLAVO9R_40203 [Flavobacterium sp. 9R]
MKIIKGKFHQKGKLIKAYKRRNNITVINFSYIHITVKEKNKLATNIKL